MSKSLVIVESPAKAKTISNYLGSNFIVKYSLGHIKDLPKNRLGVDINNGFSPEYEILKGREKVLKEIKKIAKNVDNIYLAPDPDREGEAISWHIAEELKKSKGNIHRVLFNEITKKGIMEGIRNPLQLDTNKYESQQSRRILDRLVGYMISPILWDKVKRGLSAGRVQSVAVKIICDREREIKEFVPEEYWTITARFKGDTPPYFEADLIKVKIKKEEEALNIVNNLRNVEFSIKSIEKKERKRYPSPPFITSTLQQEAYRKLRFSAKKTMMIAQKLYEGIELGKEGPVGLITYMRTDSTRIADDAIKEVRNFIKNRFGQEYLPKVPLKYKSRKEAQEAHEAIRPTSIMYEPDNMKEYLTRDALLLYELIWKRFLASQMEPAIFDQTVIEIKANGYTFRSTGSVLRFPGFISVYIEGEDERVESDGDRILPDLMKGDILELIGIRPLQHFTEPPSRFNESTLIKELEENGIGRPSTYAAILSNIQERKYVMKNKDRFIPTDLGFLVTDLLTKNFSNILNIKFTAKMEKYLDKVEAGEINWVKLLEGFYSPFEKELNEAKLNMKNVKREGIPTDISCEICGNKMTVKWGKHGEFLACSSYPECKNTKEFKRGENEEVIVEDIKEICEICGKPMVKKKGKYGEFLACKGYPECNNRRAVSLEKSGEICDKCGGELIIKKNKNGNRFLACINYPRCKNAKPLSTNVSCPNDGCDGELIERTSKRGIFYGCSKYPQCKFIISYKPIPIKCPSCGALFMIEKKGVKECFNKECRYIDRR